MKSIIMKNKDNIIIGGTIAFALLFAVTAVLFKVFEIEIFPSQIYGALMGSVITCIITLLLLRGQTSSEELKERNMAVFNFFTKGLLQFGRCLPFLCMKQTKI